MADNLSKKQRSYCMSRVKRKDTVLETKVRTELFKQGLRFRKHVTALPGRPDIVFPTARLAVFLDGDFWHGYRFPAWQHMLSKFWREKIGNNRDRDRRNFAKLRRMGWRVLRIWQHEIEHDLNACTIKVISMYSESAKRFHS
jgi:DNA mismatch endonuclease (patch repair protein)